MAERYDFIIGFGNACSCTQVLRAAKLQHLSFPFDWVIYERNDDLRCRADTLASDFAHWLDAEDLVFRGNVDWFNKDIYFNTRTKCLFNHEFPKGSDFKATYPSVREKYDRRIKRLFDILGKSSRVLVVRLDRPDQNIPTSVEDCDYLLQTLARKFPNAQFDLLLFNFRKGVPFERAEVSNPSAHITRVIFDYKNPDPASTSYAPDIKRMGALLAERYEVADYRTKEEKAALKRKEKLEKYKRFGATNYLGYKIAKLSAMLTRK